MPDFFGKIINELARYPLHYGAQNGNYAKVRRFINLGVPVESRFLGFTPLYFSTLGNDENTNKCTIELLKHNASPDAIVSYRGKQIPILAMYFNNSARLNLLRLLALHSKLLPDFITNDDIADEIKEKLRSFYSIQNAINTANDNAENLIKQGDYRAASKEYQQIGGIWSELSENEREQVYKDYYFEQAQFYYEKAESILQPKQNIMHLKQH